MDFEKAKVAAQIRLEKIIGAEITQDFFDVSYRAYILGVREEKFDWKAAIPKSTHDFDAYESLKKYCAILIGKNEPLPNELKSWLINLISKSIELNKLNSAESLITFSERFFETNNEKIIFYGLYTSLRNAKFPQFKDASFIIDKDSRFPCSFKNAIAKLFVMNGPEIPIAQKEFESIGRAKLTNLDSVIPGFDLASAHLNNETIEFNLDIFCIENGEVFSVRNLIILDKNQPSNTYKINSNEWLKKLQEL